MPRIDVALVYSDGRKEVVSVGRPADLIAFADNFDKAAPSEPYGIRELAWLAHRALKVEQPLDDWVETLDDLVGDDDAVQAIRDELAGRDPHDAGLDATLELPAANGDEAPATKSGTESLA
jgi:hypothetical protein